MEEIVIPGEGYTLGCMLTPYMFENGATFAACIVPHPQETSLTIKVSHSDGGKKCILDSILDARQVLESWKSNLLKK